jgi:hypothetical protein
METVVRQFTPDYAYTANVLGRAPKTAVQVEFDVHLPCPTGPETEVIFRLVDTYNARLGADFGAAPVPSICSVLRAHNFGAVHDAYGEMVYVGVPPYAASDIPVRVHQVCAAWICEATEIYARQFAPTWISTWSHGEALSRFMGETYLPTVLGPYGIQSVAAWLNTPGRPDWVTRSAVSETEQVPIGCALAFLHYLRDGLKFPIARTIAAEGETLEAKYHSLTGKSGGYAAMRAVLDRKFPVGKPVPDILAIDDPFAPG